MLRKWAWAACGLILISLISVDAYHDPGKARMETEPHPSGPRVDIDYGRIPLYFIPNQGQVEATALFYADTSQYTLWITRAGLVFDSQRRLASSQRYERDVSRVRFVNSSPHAEVIPGESSGYRVSYFRGKDSSRWQTGIRTSRSVLYRSLYPRIDLRVYGVERQIEYDFIIKPKGKVSDIGFVYQDIQGTRLDAEGNLIIQTAFGALSHSRPFAYQEIHGRRVEVEASFVMTGENAYGFHVGDYDPTRDLVIDPLVIVYSTYVGGKGGEGSTWVAVDSTGAAYLTSWVNSRNFPTKNALYPEFGGDPTDACITKLSPDGRSLVYSSYLGGSERDGPIDITVDITGAAYITGRAGVGFPSVNALRELQDGADAFVVKVDPSGTSLVYSTFLGGSDFDRGRGIAADAAGNAYVVGTTWSQDFPTKKAFQKKNAGASDAFLTKIDPSGNAILFSTYIGGIGEDRGLDIDVDGKGQVYVVGDTQSKNFPKAKAFQKKLRGDTDGFLMKFGRKGKKLIYSTYLGGSMAEEMRDIDVDLQGNAYVIGSTNSGDFPVANALYDTLAGDYDIFLTKFKRKGNKVHFSTYLGGNKVDNGHSVRVDRDNTIYVRGYTESKKFPTKDAFFKKYLGNGDAVLAQFSADGQSLLFSTFFGGKGWERGYGFALDDMGGIYLASSTDSADIPVKKAFQKKLKGGSDMFVTKFIKK